MKAINRSPETFVAKIDKNRNSQPVIPMEEIDFLIQ